MILSLVTPGRIRSLKIGVTTSPFRVELLNTKKILEVPA
jgi:hypothetical protein